MNTIAIALEFGAGAYAPALRAPPRTGSRKTLRRGTHYTNYPKPEIEVTKVRTNDETKDGASEV
jgi:hypothetical protein